MLNITPVGAAPTAGFLPRLTQFDLASCGVDAREFCADIVPTFGFLPVDVYEKRRRQLQLLKSWLPVSHHGMLDERFPSFFCGQLDGLGAAFPEIQHLLSTAQIAQAEESGSVRFRSVAKLVATVQHGHVHMKRVPTGAFVQKTTDPADFRSLPRLFSEACGIVENEHFQRLCRFVVNEVLALEQGVRQMTLTIHQVLAVATADTPFVLPDGVHQDGADYIVSAIPLLIENIDPPTSSVFDLTGRTLLETKLAVGQGLFHDDRIYFHSVGPVTTNAVRGRRGIIGLDITIDR